MSIKRFSQVVAAVAVAAAVTSAPEAQAGFGSTAYMTSTVDPLGTLGAGGWAPTLDYRSGALLFQFPALNLLGGLTSSYLDFGLGVSGTMARGQMSGTTDGVFMLGGEARYLSFSDLDVSGFSLMGKGRLGAEVKKTDKKGMGFGIYVVPRLGIAKLSEGDMEIAWGGGIEMSAWFSGK